DLRSDLLLPDSLALAQHLLLLRIHFQPTLRISPKHLTVLRTHSCRSAMKLVRATETAPATSTPLSLGKAGYGENEQKRCYKEELSSHRAFSSEATNSSRSATTS